MRRAAERGALVRGKPQRTSHLEGLVDGDRELVGIARKAKRVAGDEANLRIVLKEGHLTGKEGGDGDGVVGEARDWRRERARGGKRAAYQALVEGVLGAKCDLLDVHLFDDVPRLFVDDVDAERRDLGGVCEREKGAERVNELPSGKGCGPERWGWQEGET